MAKATKAPAGDGPVEAASAAVEDVFAGDAPAPAGDEPPTLDALLAEFGKAAGAVAVAARTFMDAGVGGRDAIDAALRLFDTIFHG